IYSRTRSESVSGSPYTISAVLSPAGVLSNYSITYNTAAFTITQATQTITFTSFSVAASSTSGSTVIFGTTSQPSVCTVTTTGMVTINGPGTCIVTATEGGNTNYLPVSRSTNPIVQ